MLKWNGQNIKQIKNNIQKIICNKPWIINILRCIEFFNCDILILKLMYDYKRNKNRCVNKLQTAKRVKLKKISCIRRKKISMPKWKYTRRYVRNTIFKSIYESYVLLSTELLISKLFNSLSLREKLFQILGKLSIISSGLIDLIRNKFRFRSDWSMQRSECHR